MPAQEKPKEVEESPTTAAQTMPDVVPERKLLVWKAPARPFKRRNREFYLTLFAGAFLVGLVIFLIEGWVPVILIISLIFLFYILNTVEPEEIEYEITNKGIKIAGQRTFWWEMTRYWFSQRYDSELLVFETINLPGRLELVINKEDKGKIKKSISQYLTQEKSPPSVIEKFTDFVAKRMPGNK